jgi:hypothetical protein
MYHSFSAKFALFSFSCIGFFFVVFFSFIFITNALELRRTNFGRLRIQSLVGGLGRAVEHEFDEWLKKECTRRGFFTTLYIIFIYFVVANILYLIVITPGILLRVVKVAAYWIADELRFAISTARGQMDSKQGRKWRNSAYEIWLLKSKNASKELEAKQDHDFFNKTLQQKLYRLLRYYHIQIINDYLYIFDKEYYEKEVRLTWE